MSTTLYKSRLLQLRIYVPDPSQFHPRVKCCLGKIMPLISCVQHCENHDIVWRFRFYAISCSLCKAASFPQTTIAFVRGEPDADRFTQAMFWATLINYRDKLIYQHLLQPLSLDNWCVKELYAK